MDPEIARSVFPVLSYGLALMDRAVAREDVSLAQEKACLGRLLAGTRETVLYGLVSWLDEILIFYTPLAPVVTNNTFEWDHFHSKNRATEFWERQDKAAATGDRGTLEVFFLCAMLGFRGTLRDTLRLDELRQRRDNMRHQIEPRGGNGRAVPPAGAPKPDDRLLDARKGYDRMIRILCIVLGLFVGLSSFVVLKVVLGNP